MTWRGVEVLVTGGASFIGSQFVDALVKQGAKVAAVDTGPYCRTADIAKLFERTGWRPEVTFARGLAQTMDWYHETKSAADIESRLPKLLFER